MLKKIAVIILLVLLVLPANSIEKYVCDNGLTIVSESLSGSSLVSMQLFINVGSLNESESEQGLSHVLEHMLFKGTKRRGLGQIAKEIQALGGSTNAFTSYQMTSYYITVPKENFDEALDILVDMVFEPTLDGAELQKEKEVILEEINMREDRPSAKVFELLLTNLYPQSKVGRRVIGTASHVKSFTRDHMESYHSRYYVPNNMVMVVVGDVAPDVLQAKIEDKTARYMARPIMPRNKYVSSILKSPRVILRPGNVEKTYFSFGFNIPDVLSSQIPALDVLSTILGSGAGSRFNQVLKEEKKLVQSISSGVFVGNHPGTFIISGVADASNIPLIQDEIIDIISGIKSKGVSLEELERIKAQVKSSRIYEQEDVSSLARELGYYEMFHKVELKKVYEDQLSNISVGDIKDVANSYLDFNGAGMVVYYPKSEIVSYNVNVLREKLSSEVLETGIEKRDRSEQTSKAVTSFTSQNGIKVILREDHSLPIISFGAYMKSPFLKETDLNNGITALTLKSVMKGTNTKSYKEISEIMDDNSISLGPVIDKNVAGLAGSSITEKFDVLFDLFVDIVNHSSFSQEEVLKEKTLYIKNIRTRKENAASYASYLADKKLYQTLPYRRPLIGEEASVSSLTHINLRKWFYSEFNLRNMTFVFCGDIDRAGVEKYLSSISLDQKKEPVIQQLPFEELKSDIKEEISLDKEQSVVVIKYLAPQVGSNDFYVMKVINSILSGMGSRLFEKLREEEGLVYSTYSYMASGNPQGSFVVYAGVKPGKEKKSVDIIYGELKKLVFQKVGDQELDKAKKLLSGAFVRSMESRDGQKSSYARFELLGMGYEAVHHFIDRVNAVTADDIKRVAEQYFDKNSVEIVVKSK